MKNRRASHRQKRHCHSQSIPNPAQESLTSYGGIPLVVKGFRALGVGTLSEPELAVSFLANYLPPEVVTHLNLASHELVQNSFVDEDLREHQSDLLFRIPLVSGGTSYVYILFEHKSGPDQWVVLQLLRYMVRTWGLPKPSLS